MKVGINAEPLFQRVATGAGVYTLALCDAMAAIGHTDDLLLFHAAHALVPPEVEALPLERREFPLEGAALYASWTEARRPAPQTICGPLDVVHAPGPMLPPGGAAAVVATVHDLAPLRFPDRYPRDARLTLKRGLRFAAREADRIICPSHSTAEEVQELLGVERDRLRIVPHGVAMPAPDPERATRFVARRGFREPYVLWLGTQEERKNVLAVLDAFERVSRADPAVTLVVHGPQGWLGAEVADGIRRRRLEDRSRVSEGGLTREELAALYSRASVFLFPSIYEGFGLPVLEAMACGAPVITSDRSAMPESAGDAAVLVDPDDHDALGDALGGLLADADTRADLARRGRARAADFTWEVTARRTWDVYEELVDA
jgi:glycosyltransferase involved in cell wall biosynthesis